MKLINSNEGPRDGRVSESQNNRVNRTIVHSPSKQEDQELSRVWRRGFIIISALMTLRIPQEEASKML